MVIEPDVLLLDEPTNHLDIQTIAWLESLLVESNASVIFVTHDRSFLDAVATRIIELDRGRLSSYPGNYAAYRRRKAEELEAERTGNARFDKLLAQEEVWIRQGIEARRTRNEGRVRRLERLRDERAARRERSKDVNLALAAGERSGRIVAELENVTKGYGEGDERRIVVRDFSATLLRGDRVGLIGPNGAGKTTLLKLILGELEPDAGTIKRGTKLTVAYFDQTRAALDPERTLLETISPGSDWIELGEGPDAQRKHAMTYLGDFLFAPARARSPVKSLSGGERNRLLLARLFARPANVLVLDEPTNDLDIETLELLEALLAEYNGTIFLVSHDRAFLDNVVTQTIAYEGRGSLARIRRRLRRYRSRASARTRGRATAGEGRQGRGDSEERGESARRAQSPRLQGTTRTRCAARHHRGTRSGAGRGRDAPRRSGALSRRSSRGVTVTGARRRTRTRTRRGTAAVGRARTTCGQRMSVARVADSPDEIGAACFLGTPKKPASALPLRDSLRRFSTEIGDNSERLVGQFRRCAFSLMLPIA